MVVASVTDTITLNDLLFRLVNIGEFTVSFKPGNLTTSPSVVITKDGKHIADYGGCATWNDNLVAALMMLAGTNNAG